MAELSAEEMLYRKMMQHSKLERDQIANALLSAPGTFNSIRNEGPTAGRAYADSWRAKPSAEVDPIAVAEAKAKLVGTLAELQKIASTRDADLMKLALERDNTLMKEIIGSVTSLLVATQGNNAKLAENANTLTTTLAKEGTEALMRASGIGGGGGNTLGGGGSAGGGRDAKILGGRLNEMGTLGSGMDDSGADLLNNPEFWTEFTQGVYNSTSNDATRDVYNATEAALQRRGLTVQDAIEFAKANPGIVNPNDTIMLNETYSSSGAAGAGLVANTIGAPGTDDAGGSGVLGILDNAQKMLTQGVSGPAKGEIDRLFTAYKDAIGTSDPDKIANIARDIGNIPVPKNESDTISKIGDALDDLDDPDNGLDPKTRKQAKDQIMALREFEDFMRTNGLQDPDTAFRALRQKFRAERNTRKVADRLTMWEKKGKGLKWAPEPTEATGDTTPRPATDEEAAQISFGPADGAKAEAAWAPATDDEMLDSIDLESRRKTTPLDVDEVDGEYDIPGAQEVAGRRVSPNGSKTANAMGALKKGASAMADALKKNGEMESTLTAQSNPALDAIRNVSPQDSVRKRMAKLLRDQVAASKTA